MRLRRSEQIAVVYYLYAFAAAVGLALPTERLQLIGGVNLAVIAAVLLLAYAQATKPRRLLGYVRDLLPIALVLLAYQQMGWFTLSESRSGPPYTATMLEEAWVGWDRVLLGEWRLREAIEAFGVLLPSLLEISYTLTYLVAPFCVALIYSLGAESSMDRFLTVYLLGTLGSYTMYPYFPSEPPRAVYPGELFPNVDTGFRQLNWWILSGGGIHTSVFPSGHVSSVFAASAGLGHALGNQSPWPRAMMSYSVLVLMATVYGRYHYTVDGLAGAAVAFAAAAAGRALFQGEFQGDEQ